MDKVQELHAKNTARAWEIVEDTDIVNIWKSVGAEPNLVGSLKMDLLIKHRDIDFHVYSSSLKLSESYEAMSKLAANKSIKKIESVNLIHTEEECIEWHAWYQDIDGDLWQLDIINILRGSFFDGYAEKFTDRMLAVMTPETKQAILQLKYNTPDDEKILSLEYYQAVVKDGVRNYAEFTEWRKNNPVNGLILWMP